MTDERTIQEQGTRSTVGEPEVVIDLTDPAVADGGRVVIDLTGGVAAPAAAPAPATAPAAATAPAPATARGETTGEWLSPLTLLLAVNMLNVLDAALTVLWLDLGVAQEANPIVDAIGFPAKVVGVAAGSWVVYRLKPRWLLVPAAALAVVSAYHLLGGAVALLG